MLFDAPVEIFLPDETISNVPLTLHYTTLVDLLDLVLHAAFPVPRIPLAHVLVIYLFDNGAEDRIAEEKVISVEVDLVRRSGACRHRRYRHSPSDHRRQLLLHLLSPSISKRPPADRYYREPTALEDDRK